MGRHPGSECSWRLPAIAGAAAWLAFAGCSESSPGSPCDGVTCGGHGECLVDGPWPVCVCEPGYRPAGTSCVPEADAGDVAREADADTADDAGDTGGALVVLHGDEFEFAVNVDAPERSRVRFYGGFTRAPGVAQVTGARVTALSVTTTTRGTREASDPQPPGGGTLDPLPLAQQTILADLAAAAEDLALCAGATPALVRGTAGVHDVVVRLAGTSSQGDWEAEATVPGDDVLLTCHRGLGSLGSGSASLIRSPDPVGDTSNLSVVVQLLAAPATDTATIDSLVLAGEGVADTFAVPAEATATPCDGGRPCVVLSYAGNALVPGTLCPARPALPPPIYFLYSGSIDAGAFSGAAPAGQCQNLLDGP